MRTRRSQPVAAGPTLALTALLALVLAFAAGCSAAGSTPTPSPAGIGPPTPGSGGSSSEPADDGFGWVPFGPTSPNDPPYPSWYRMVQGHNCSGLEIALESNNDPLWRGMQALCAAVFEHDATKWAVAQAAQAEVAQAPAPDESVACLASAATALLTRALTWHAQHPDAQPVVQLAKPGAHTACPFTITSVVVVDENDTQLPGPIRGPVSGGTLLRISGAGFTAEPTVRVAGHPAEIVSGQGSGTLTVRTPSVTHPLVANIRVRNPDGEVKAPVTFRYVAASGSAT